MENKKVVTDPDSFEKVVYVTCPSCDGLGGYDVGDCEAGVWESCEECNGDGFIPDGDVFIPERDAFTPND